MITHFERHEAGPVTRWLTKAALDSQDLTADFYSLQARAAALPVVSAQDREYIDSPCGIAPGQHVTSLHLRESRQQIHIDIRPYEAEVPFKQSCAYLEQGKGFSALQNWNISIKLSRTKSGKSPDLYQIHQNQVQLRSCIVVEAQTLKDKPLSKI